jgi:phage shock protein A
MIKNKEKILQKIKEWEEEKKDLLEKYKIINKEKLEINKSIARLRNKINIYKKSLLKI